MPRVSVQGGVLARHRLRRRTHAFGGTLNRTTEERIAKILVRWQGRRLCVVRVNCRQNRQVTPGQASVMAILPATANQNTTINVAISGVANTPGRKVSPRSA